MSDYEAILRLKYPAKAHAQRVVEHLRSERKDPALTGVLYLESGRTKMLEDSDQAEPFRQRRNFNYLTGCPLADSYFTYDIASAHSVLYIPPVDPESVIWSGLPLSPEEALERYDVDEVRLSGEVDQYLQQYASTAPKPSRVFVIAGQLSGEVSDNNTLLKFDDFDLSLLKEAIEECRVVKDDYEVALLRKANVISSAAHRSVMEKVSRVRNETELEALFLERCVSRGAKKQGYDPIVASGTAAATLHYTANNAPMESKLNLLIDAACEWDCYSADITRTMPILGEFSTRSRAIYDIVLKMQQDCIDFIRTGVLWEDVHTLAHRIAIRGLLEIGLLKGDPAEILAARTSTAFFPHGLGHYLGMDTHDTGGHADYNDPDPMFRYLRVRGPLPQKCVITVEPGIYFCRPILEKYIIDPKHKQFMDQHVLDDYWNVGGVRIEDNVVVLDDGVENLSTAPKKVNEIETIIREGGMGPYPRS